MYEDVKAVLFDLDGTIYYGSKLIEGAAQVVDMFRKQGKRVFFTTNNSTKSRKQIYEKLMGMGLNCSLEEVYTSGYAAALYAREKGYHTVYIMGSDALIGEFAELGITTSNQAEVVVIGYDMQFNYEKLTDGLQVALGAKALIACNKERHYPGENAKRMPGCGAMVGALEGSLGKKVDYVVGKPNPLLLHIICSEQDLDASNILFIGDTYESDIRMSKDFGCRSIYIGEEKHEDVTTVGRIKEILDMKG